VSDFVVTATDEGRHPPEGDQLWGESWYHDFAAADGSYGGYTRLGLYPNLGAVWYWVHLVREGKPLALIRNHAVPCPPVDAPLDLGADALTASWTNTKPLEAWRVTTKGRGVLLDEPAAAFHGEQGEAVDIAIDLEWSGAAPVFPYTMTTRYEQAAWVTGEMRIGGETITVDCPGERDHSWGVRDWWLFPWIWTSGHLDDGTWFHGVRSLVPGVDTNFQIGFLVEPGQELRPVDRVRAEPELDAEKLPVRADLDIGGLQLAMTAELHAPVLLVAEDGRESRFSRALCRFEAPDGRAGRGWTEFNWPPGFPAVEKS
jgi:hypothetical protein